MGRGFVPRFDDLDFWGLSVTGLATTGATKNKNRSGAFVYDDVRRRWFLS